MVQSYNNFMTLVVDVDIIYHFSLFIVLRLKIAYPLLSFENKKVILQTDFTIQY